MKQKYTHTTEFARRFSVLVGELDFIINDEQFRRDLVERLVDGCEWLSRLDAVMALALEYDGGRLLPRKQASTLESNR